MENKFEKMWCVEATKELKTLLANEQKMSAKEIANKLSIEGSGAYVRVSQLKKQAVDKLIENVDHSQVLDYL